MGNDARAALDRAKQRVGSVLRDKWHLDALIGVGGMAAVYSATHRNGKRAALKLLHPEFCAQPEFVRRFLREGYVANKIAHPAGVAVLDDDGTEEGSVFLVMELLEGDALDRYTKRNGPRLPLKRILEVADEVLDLLAAAHSKGIVHRDIKPANIFLTRDDKIRVLDFGIARLAERTLDASSTQTGSAMGTPAYMPPEQARGRWNLVDVRTDLWSVGATMFALITGDRPRRAETVQEELLLAMTVPLPSLLEVATGVPSSVSAFVARAVAHEMDGRFADARTMQQALRDVMRGGRFSDAPPPLMHPGSAPLAGSGRDAPSHLSGVPQDTAPVIHGDGSVSGTDPTQLASGHTAAKAAAPGRGRVIVAGLIGVATAMGALAVGVNVWFRMHASSPAGDDFSGSVTQTASPGADPASNRPNDPPAPTAPAPVAPGAPVLSASATPAAAAAPPSTAPSATAHAAPPLVHPTGASHKPPPKPAADPASANPLDQRF